MIVISSNDSKWNSWVDDPVDPSAGCSTVPTSMYRKACWRSDVLSLYRRSAVLTRPVEIPGAILTAVRSRLRPDDKDLQKRRNELLSTVFRIQDRNDRNLRDWNTHIDISAGMLRSPGYEALLQNGNRTCPLAPCIMHAILGRCWPIRQQYSLCFGFPRVFSFFRGKKVNVVLYNLDDQDRVGTILSGSRCSKWLLIKFCR